jgi:uncharacterized membrane protein
VRLAALVPIALLVSGALLLILAVVEGGAQLAVVVVVPVFFGQSWVFAVAIVLLVAGFFTLPLAFSTYDAPDPSPEDGPASTSGGSGGLVLIGPVPIFFGSWRGVSTRTRVVVAILGGALLVAFVLLLFWARS